MKIVTVHTDGGCQGNPGPGGWGAVLDFRGQRKEISGGEPATTNNRMELRAAIAALAVLKEPCQIELFTDSEYLRDGISKWLPNWKRNGWKTAAKKPVKNDDLWRELDRLAAGHRIVWRWLKGHAGHALNERCDRLANAQMTQIRSTHTAGQLRALRDEFSARQAGATSAGL